MAARRSKQKTYHCSPVVRGKTCHGNPAVETKNLSLQPGSRYLTRKTYHYSPAVHQKPIIALRQSIKTYHYNPAVHQKPIIAARRSGPKAPDLSLQPGGQRQNLSF
jgi:hypothetical protein